MQQCLIIKNESESRQPLPPPIGLVHFNHRSMNGRDRQKSIPHRLCGTEWRRPAAAGRNPRRKNNHASTRLPYESIPDCYVFALISLSNWPYYLSAAEMGLTTQHMRYPVKTDNWAVLQPVAVADAAAAASCWMAGFDLVCRRTQHNGIQELVFREHERSFSSFDVFHH